MSMAGSPLNGDFFLRRMGRAPKPGASQSTRAWLYHVTHDDTNPLTKAQGEILYAYYTDLGLRQETEKYIS